VNIPFSFKCSLGLSEDEMRGLRDSITTILARTKHNNK
jgi:hypothetical protein